MKKNFSMAVAAILAILSLFLFSNLRAQDVGIGTTTPLYRLHVSAAKSSLLKLENTNALNTGVTSDLFFATGARYTGAIKTIGTSSSNARLGFFTLASADSSLLLERLSILDNGDVGIGTNNPGAKLEVNGQVKITGGSPGLGKVLVSNASGLATWELVPGISGTINYVPKFVTTTTLGNSQIFDDGTNVGIGTITPAIKLHVKTDSTAIRGESTALTGQVYGVHGITNSFTDFASGVKGEALNSTGSTYTNGVWGYNLSTSSGATGVFGEAAGATGITYGVHGSTLSTTTGGVAGVFGEAAATTGVTYGVKGYSASTHELAAGLRAMGTGVSGPGAPQAAALELYNGAIRVSGPVQAAGKVDFGPGPWVGKATCSGGADLHSHIFGFYIDVTITNPLIKSDSYILITAMFTPIGAIYCAALTGQGAGVAYARVSYLGPYCPGGAGETGTLYYLIINH